MTISTTKNKVQYAGDGVTSTFIYDFLIPIDTDMIVTIDGVVITTGYVVNGAGNPLGGDVVFTTPPAVGEIIVLLRSIPPTQEMDLRPYDAFPADAIEDAFDKLTMLVQDLGERASRSVVADITFPPTLILEMPPYKAGYGIQWNPTVPNELELTSEPIDGIISDAEAARDAALISEINAAISEAGAAASRTRADEWANNPEDIPVTTAPNKYSAFHWAEKAQQAAIGTVLANKVVYDDSVTGWGVTELQSANEFIEANFARQGDSYLKSETYNSTEVYAKGETYSQAEVDILLTATEETALGNAVAMAIALG